MIPRFGWMPQVLGIALSVVLCSSAIAQQGVANQSTTAPVEDGSRQIDSHQRKLSGLPIGTAFRDCSDCPVMVAIATPDSVFDGGSPERMAIGRYEITRAQFDRFVRESRYAMAGRDGCFVWKGLRYANDAANNWRNPGFDQTPQDPVVCVNWSDASAYAAWLSSKSGYTYRLPTEAEWEHAARAGSTLSRPWGEDTRNACRFANVADDSAKAGVPGTVNTWKYHDCDDGYAYTAPVGSFPPNAWGIHDMLGNAWEWTADCFTPAPDAATPSTSDVTVTAAGVSDASVVSSGTGAAQAPPAAVSGSAERCEQRVLRGGAWVDSPDYVSFGFRFLINQNDRDAYAGFRVVRVETSATSGASDSPGLPAPLPRSPRERRSAP